MFGPLIEKVCEEPKRYSNYFEDVENRYINKNGKRKLPKNLKRPELYSSFPRYLHLFRLEWLPKGYDTRKLIKRAVGRPSKTDPIMMS